MGDTYQKNIKTVKQEILRIIATKEYKTFSAKQQVVCSHIFKKILCSEYAYCSESNRTIAEKCHVSPDTVNRTRINLYLHNFVEITPLFNGKRSNPRYRVQLTNVPLPKFEAHSEPCKLREQVLNDLEFDLRDLKSLRLGLLRSTEKLIELAQEKLRTGKSLAELLEVPQGKKISSVDFSPIRLSTARNPTRFSRWWMSIYGL